MVIVGVKSKMSTIIDVKVPKLFPTHTTREILKIEKWHVHEGDILQPEMLMVSLETPPGFYDIPAPPEVIVPCRVVSILTSEGGEIRLNEPLIILEPISESI